MEGKQKDKEDDVNKKNENRKQNNIIKKVKLSL
jgi:hypothetical protein